MSSDGDQLNSPNREKRAVALRSRLEVIISVESQQER